MRRLRLFSLVFVPILILSACNGDEEEEAERCPAVDQAGISPIASVSALGRQGEETTQELELKDEGVLTVGSNIAYAPFESYEDGDTPVGFDVELMTAIAERRELEPRFVNNPSFDALIPNLQDGQYDAVISAMTITDERRNEVDFSDPYFEADQSLTVQADSEIASTGDLTEDHVIGVERGTTGAAYAEENFGDCVKEIRTFPDTPASLGDLAAGRVDAVINDFPVSAFAAQGEFQDQIAVVQRLETGEQYGIAVRKDNTPLLDAINEALAEMRADGTYDQIFQKWFGEAP